MLHNFLKTTMRYLWRNKTYSSLNFICLTFGLTCAIIAVLFILNVLSYDKFHKNYNRLYSVEAYVTYFNGDQFPKQYLSASLTDILKEQVPEIQKFSRVAERDYTFVSGDKKFTEKGYYADPDFFNLFSFPVLHSDKSGILSDPNSIMISESMANKLYESTDCEGKTLVVNEGGEQKAFRIAGVFMKVPRESYLQFDFVIPFSKFLADNSWATETGASANQTWVLLNENADIKNVNGKIRNLIKNQETTLNQELFLFPLKEKVLYSYAGGKRVWNEMQSLVIVGSVGFAILMIACFNFINLSIALIIKRYREAGIRKVTGSGKAGILMQFLGETLILTFISLICSILIVKLLLAGFNTLFHYNIQISLLTFRTMLIFVLITVFTALASGLLPGFYLSASNPVDVLKGNISSGHSYSLFRQSLIVFQFAIPIVLIICMIIIKVQDRYMRNYDLGVEKDRLIILDNTAELRKQASGFKADLLAIPGIDAVSFTNCIPARGFRPTNEISWSGKDASEKLDFWCINTDFDYNKSVKIDLSEGRYFDPSFRSDSGSYVINDIAARIMKNNNPVGSEISVEGRKGTIIGVFRNFHVVDLAGPMVPTIIRIAENDQPTILIRYSSGSYPSITAKIRKIYGNYGNVANFNPILYRDLTSYSELNVPSNLVGLAFIIALALASMGLLGLASFTAERRTKEIGIRKTNGATTKSIISMLLSNFTKWLMIAYFISLPVAFLLGRIFLGRFHFHTSMPLWAFVAGPALAFAVALLTVFSQTWKTANRNPVDALRYE